MARALMIQGTSSWAGKSLLTTALARLIARGGIDVAPFKGVNMSNNARAAKGGEIGVAQYLQALAAGVEPTVQMNPVLVKPESQTSSQVVLLGKPDHAISAIEWRERAPMLRAAIDESLAQLMAEHDVVIAEGAGSPAEINLYDVDLANMHVAHRADASVLLVADINRGGAFAHLYGTWALLEEADRARIKGFILNRFRGDASLLAPGPKQLEELTGVPVLGVVPWLAHGLPDEDGVAAPAAPAPSGAPTVAIIRYPAASNIDEFKPLDSIAELRWATTPGELEGADLVILPGSKNVGADLAWLRTLRFDRALALRVATGGRVLAICGGMQMLGGAIIDPSGLEGGDAEGIGFLPLVTTLAEDKQVSAREATFSQLDEPWSELSGHAVSGYEIRHGASEAADELEPVVPDGIGYASGPVLAVYLHGLFENPEFTEALLGAAPAGDLDQTIDDLATAVAPHLDMSAILAMIAP
ncbi:MAG: cobyric acid synthase [Solirubrobacterales bacterium]|nr:cobyric acid synthase [Solirubrobacterales bacterium]